EKKRLAELKRKEEELKKRQAAELKKRREAEAARKKAEAEKRRKAEEARKKAEAEKRREAEATRKKAEAEKRRKAEEARRKAEAEARERELQAQFEAEQRASEAARIVRLIQEKVARNWTPPPGTLDKGLSCRVSVRLGASGSVLAVSVVQSSGNAAFDRSVERAVFKADPLPMPDDSALRNLGEFRNHTFTFDPSKNRNR
ncbi:MAG: cell envelope integrity protein TolA, partial [Gammaproteobacteria bacterium]